MKRFHDPGIVRTLTTDRTSRWRPVIERRLHSEYRLPWQRHRADSAAGRPLMINGLHRIRPFLERSTCPGPSAGLSLRRDSLHNVAQCPPKLS